MKKVIVFLAVLVVLHTIFTAHIFATTNIRMYFCSKDTLTCSATSSTYTPDAAGMAQCQNNLSQYLTGKTTGQCYAVKSQCDSACKQLPAPSPTPQTAGKMSYCRLSDRTCQKTTDTYISVAACQTNITTFLPNQTGGVCYINDNDCIAACAGGGPLPSTTPVPECRTDFCSPIAENGCMVTCCTHVRSGTSETTRCVTRVGPTPTPNPNAPTPTTGTGTGSEDLAKSCTCADGACSTSCTYNALQGVDYSSPMSCQLPTSFFTQTPSSDHQSGWCKITNKTKGDADGNGAVDNKDYLYYVTAVNGGILPPTVNPDFNGDGEIGAADRAIIITSLKGA